MTSPRTWWHVHALTEDYQGPNTAPEGEPERYQVDDPAAANVVASLGDDGLHYPALDLDGIVVHLLDSSTPGHLHLYLDRGCAWEDYCDLLRAMERCGLLQPGYVAASMERGATFVRVDPDKTTATWGDHSIATNQDDATGQAARLQLTPWVRDLVPGGHPVPAGQERF